MEGLDAPVHDLREPGEVIDRTDLEARGGELGGGASGRDQLDAETGQAAGEVDDAGLVADREQRPADPDRTGRGDARRGIDVGVWRDGSRA
jgi:hypothetical protein